MNKKKKVKGKKEKITEKNKVNWKKVKFTEA